MTPKEKAKELVDRFNNVIRPMSKRNTIKINIHMHPEHAKQCALTCVDEILKANEKISLKDLSQTMETNDILSQLTDNAMYWQEVKQEINKL